MSDNSAGVSINFFVRELQMVLAKRGFELGAIDDRTGIHREVVRRLQKALVPPGNFHMLNPDDLNEVIIAFKLEPLEIVRLRAAIIANAIIQVLIGRIRLESALAVTEKIYTDIVEALTQGDRSVSNVRTLSELRKISGAVDRADIEEMLEDKLQIFDRGISALQLREGLHDEQQRLEYLRQARTRFGDVQVALEEVDEELKKTDLWQGWHEQIEKRLAEIEEEIEDE